jgi:hypothetical protein
MKYEKLEDDKFAAAFLYSRQVSQQHIADILGCSKGSVSRWIQECQTEGILEPPVFNRKKLSKEQWDNVQALTNATDLLENIRARTPCGLPKLRRIHVYGSGKGTTKTFQKLRALNETVGRQMARDLCDCVLKSRHCMIAWGGLIASAIDEIRKTYEDQRLSQRTINFYPVCGDPFGVFNTKTSPSVLCAKMNSIFNGSENDYEFSLAGVPALIPTKVGQFGSKDENDIIRKFVGLSGTYERIFGKEGVCGERQKVDCIITGVGTNNSKDRSGADRYGLYTTRCLSMWDVDDQWLLRHTIGDIAGVYLEKVGLTTEQKKNFDKKTSFWLGAKLKDFQACARTADETGKPGVLVAAAWQENLAQVVFDCCTRFGIITELFIDDAMKRHLEKICARTDPVDGEM